MLDRFNFPYQYDYYLVRGLDYYTGLVFEIDLGTETRKHSAEKIPSIAGGQKAILGGGRYDNLYQEIANIKAPAIGFAVGIERLADYLEEKKLLKIDNGVDIFFSVIVPEAY